MNVTIDVTRGDVGLVISGWIHLPGFKTLAGVTGYSAQFSLVREPFGSPLVQPTPAVIDGFDATAGRMHLTYTVRAGDFAEVAEGRVRWLLSTPAGVIHFPGPQAGQTIIRVNS